MGSRPNRFDAWVTKVRGLRAKVGLAIQRRRLALVTFFRGLFAVRNEALGLLIIPALLFAGLYFVISTQYTDVPIPKVERVISPEKIREIASQAALRYGVDPLLIHAMIEVESEYNPVAISPKGARGVLQLMPDTATEMGVENPFDVRQNIDGAVRYLKKLHRRYRGNLWLMLAAYNAGPAKVRKHRGIPPYPETRGYVRKVIKRYNKSKKAEAKKG